MLATTVGSGVFPYDLIMLKEKVRLGMYWPD